MAEAFGVAGHGFVPMEGGWQLGVQTEALSDGLVSIFVPGTAWKSASSERDKSAPGFVIAFLPRSGLFFGFGVTSGAPSISWSVSPNGYTKKWDR
jgi:hypothetical protein